MTVYLSPGKRLSLLTLAVALVLVARSVGAAAPVDYLSGLENASDYHERAKQQFKRLGIPYGASESTPLEDTPPSLITVYPQESVSKLTAGQILSAMLPHQVVISGEAAPVWLPIQKGPSWVEGLTLLGKARASSGSRVAIELDRLKLRSGRTLTIRGVVLDRTGALALEAQVFSAKAYATVGAMGVGFLSGVASGLQTTQTTGLGIVATSPTPRNAILQGLAQSSADQSKRLIEDATKEKPILVIAPRTPVLVFMEEELKWNP